MPASEDAPVILSNEPGSFAWGVLAKRHPALIEQVREAFPCGPAQHAALDALLEETTHGVIQPLAADAHDRERWAAWGQGHFGRSWFDVPFLWAESYFYRRLLGAFGYFEPGPWQGVDPFGSFKAAELRSATVDDELAALDDLAGRPADVQGPTLLAAALWGNRADLGFRLDSGGAQLSTGAEADSPVVADDSAELWSLLPPGGAAATVHLVADNAGRELIPDLVLIDHLLHAGRAADVVLHVKPYPYYVSDATMADVIDSMRRLAQARPPGRAAQIGRRLWGAMADGRLAVRAHEFFCAPFPYDAMPADLREEFAGATVTVVKGDLNYRRLVGDRLWDPTTSFNERTAYFPGRVAALRTLKSDVITGLEQDTVDVLEATGQAWRTSGTHALIQVGGRAKNA
ncbi:damage-control phosphatase ARMT1 family protein [Streptomyces peucetius]|uniref:Damage-control phosphatase ARMT1 family protein n=1 Tax=Streptomyces peucetius TaxID=1950 RepID=A0ABY6I8L0_STRPE|nr:damage-control phosphatase ARMT1 family protein [Streptomyces peucetius]UYQ62314.1 damage-control phosphatase ARMT1 family protein [Streptomyces peucetius]